MTTGRAQAANTLSDTYNSQTELDFRQGLQMRLAWTGDYAGQFDGDIGPSTLRAIRDFQARHGMTADGVMTQPFLRLLLVESDRRQNATGFALVQDEVTGVRVGLPLAMVRDLGQTEIGRLWRAPDNSVEIETARFTDGLRTLAGLYDTVSQPTASRSVTYRKFGGDWFAVAGEEDGRSYYLRFAGRDGEMRGFSVSYDARIESEMKPFVVVASNTFDGFASAPAVASLPAPSDRLEATAGTSGLGIDGSGATELRLGRFDQPSVPGQSDAQKGVESSGTGFVVADGWLLTNAHVARACKTIVVGEHGSADSKIIDENADLALLHVSGEKLGAPLALATGDPRLGEDVLALGFPLRSILADSLNVTRGNVSSLKGLMNDARYLQISAPIQPGNSGGPLVDLAGRVVGVVTAKLNAVAVADMTGDIPQAINFAIRPDAAVRFLRQEGVAFKAADTSSPLGSVPDATAKVKDSILTVLCLGAREGVEAGTN
ncbi:trypsin-like peptidase domain-containing protein [Consotaella salsifontis]|nr:trypsin-like peptidase domain-containing protein [Consotaella salsifontis]